MSAPLHATQRSVLRDYLGFYPYKADSPRMISMGEDETVECVKDGEITVYRDGAERKVPTLAKQPEGISIRLFDHQLKSVYDMEQMEKGESVTLSCGATYIRTVGIQADTVGYGKTLSMVALVQRDAMDWDINCPEVKVSHFTYEYLGYYQQTSYLVRLGKTLILASLSCIDMWLENLSFSTLKVYLVKSRKHIREFDVSNDSDVILVTPTMLNRLIVRIKHLCPTYILKRFIYDEPAQTRVSAMSDISARFIWFVSATPSRSVRTQPGGSWVRHVFCRLKRCGLLQQVTVRNPISFCKSSFKMPETNYVDYICWQPLARHLHGLVSEEVNRMVQAGDVQGAITAMGGSQSSKLNLIDILIARKDRELRFIEFKIEECSNESATNRQRANLGQLKSRRQVIQEQIAKLRTAGSESLKENCPICLDDLCEPVLEKKCGKIFCGRCILTWVMAHRTCPNCRVELSVKDLVHISDDPRSVTDGESKSSNDTPRRPPTKLECIKQIIQNRPDAKFIIASQYIGGYSRIMTMLDDMNIKYCKISGRASTRSKRIEEFQNGNMRVIFITNLESTAGVNLQSASDIIIYNDMPPSIREQIIGRANRIGRVGEVTVHTLRVDRGSQGRSA